MRSRRTKRRGVQMRPQTPQQATKKPPIHIKPLPAPVSPRLRRAIEQGVAAFRRGDYVTLEEACRDPSRKATGRPLGLRWRQRLRAGR